MINMPLEWMRAASDDLDAAEKLLGSDHLTHIVSFHCQQAVEKSFKAILEQYAEKIEKTHNLEKLYTKVSKYCDIDLDENLLLQIDELYIDSRYPADFGLLPDGKPPISQVKEYITFARYVFQRVKTHLQA